MTHAQHNGFTLIELSIALVIIGLIAGGILIGQDLIHAAQVRQTISQKEKFTAAVNTFQRKYNCLPGDCGVNATELGFSGGDGPFRNEGTEGMGNGVIYTGGGQNNGPEYWFWEELFEAGLIPVKSIPANTQFSVTAGDCTPSCPICNRAANTDGNGVSYPAGGWLVVDLEDIPSLGCASVGLTYPAAVPTYRAFALTHANMVGANTATISSADGFAIDAKIDDGKPFTGSVIAVFYAYYSDTTCSGDPKLTALNRPTSGTNANNSYAGDSNYDFDLLMKAGF